MTAREKELYDAICAGVPERVLEMIRCEPRLLQARMCGNATPLLLAAYRGRLDLADRLLALGANLDLIAAVCLGRTETVSGMLESNQALVHKRSPDGWSALHLAASFADAEMVQNLIVAGADVNEPHRKSGVTPLFFASRPPFAIARLLLKHRADINARAKHGLTILHGGAASGSVEWVRFLLDHGADPDAQTVARQTPWSLAVRYNHPRVAELLTSKQLRSG